MSKTKHPRAAALAVAEEILGILEPVCARLIVAGSIRRRADLVGDVEIMFVPVFDLRKVDMFAFAEVCLTAEVISKMIEDGRISKRLTEIGTTSWGLKNKLALHTASGIPVDLFSTTAENWPNYLACRTGPAESNVRICVEAEKRGWKWHPYGNGFTKINGSEPPYVVKEERDVFEFVGLDYLEPWERA